MTSKTGLTVNEKRMLVRLERAGMICWTFTSAKETRTLRRLVVKGLAKEIEHNGLTAFVPIDRVSDKQEPQG